MPKLTVSAFMKVPLLCISETESVLYCNGQKVATYKDLDMGLQRKNNLYTSKRREAIRAYDKYIGTLKTVKDVVVKQHKLKDGWSEGLV